uniref:Uncharacterized protein n=1 Tax=Lymantria dispar multicapsid nuclear polyhedrosis virus TaxID=10449 RepID=A0A1B1MR17_NPVLD|nr:hypothetical protein [Lymantria dispar multiple nucleopolyhedrovirus]
MNAEQQQPDINNCQLDDNTFEQRQHKINDQTELFTNYFAKVAVEKEKAYAEIEGYSQQQQQHHQHQHLTKQLYHRLLEKETQILIYEEKLTNAYDELAVLRKQHINLNDSIAKLININHQLKKINNILTPSEEYRHYFNDGRSGGNNRRGRPSGGKGKLRRRRSKRIASRVNRQLAMGKKTKF